MVYTAKGYSIVSILLNVHHKNFNFYYSQQGWDYLETTNEYHMVVKYSVQAFQVYMQLCCFGTRNHQTVCIPCS